MAQRRMFSKHIIDSDAFLDMPLSTQALYFHLSMRADDDGFINNPKKIMRMVGASEDELKVLMSKRFLLGFETGVIVIKHWRMHNQIRKDRHNETVYQEEFSKLDIKENGSYSEKIDQKQEKIDWQPNGNHLEPQVSIGKDSIGKDRLVEVSKEDKKPTPKNKKIKPDGYENISFTEPEAEKLNNDYDRTTLTAIFDKLEHYKGASGRKYKSDYSAIKQWVAKSITEEKTKYKKNNDSTEDMMQRVFDNLKDKV